MGIVDEVIWEAYDGDKELETFAQFPVLRSRIHNFLRTSFDFLNKLSGDQLVSHRYGKFRKMGTFQILDEERRKQLIFEAEAKVGNAKKGKAENSNVPSLLVKHLAQEIVCGGSSRYRKLAPISCPESSPIPVTVTPRQRADNWTNAKKVLDAGGPEALVRWVKEQKRVLITDTTMRDAHQSLVATRARTEDLTKGAVLANELLKDAFRYVFAIMYLLVI